MSLIHSGHIRFQTARAATSVLLLGVLLSACGGGGGGGGYSGGGGAPPPPATYTIGGTISGLTGSGLVLQDNGGNNLAVNVNSTSFMFPTAVASGTSYAVTVSTQPTGENCTVSNGTGMVGSANVTNIAITCSGNSFTVGGTISGLTGSGLVLQLNGANNVTPAASSTSFTFTKALASGSAYTVTVATQPSNPSQTCTVSNGTGTVGMTNVTNVAITCKTQYTIGGTIAGLSGSGLVLQDNGGDNLDVAALATSFKFATSVASGQPYAVTVQTQPTSPTQTCTVTNGSGTVASANVSNIAVICVNPGKYVFVANTADGANGDVAAFTINAATGALTPVSGSPFLADSSPNGVVVDPSGQFVYVSNGSSLDVSQEQIGATGALTLIPPSEASTASVPRAIAITPNDTYVYTAGYGTVDVGTIFGYIVNGNTGALVGIQNQPFSYTNAQLGIAVDPTSQFVFSTGNSHFLFVSTIDSTTGVLTQTLASPYSITAGATGVAVWPRGTTTGGYVYTANQTNGNVSAFAYDGNGNVTTVGTVDAGSGTKAVAIDPLGKYLYAANYNDGTISQYSINQQTGALTSIAAAVATGNLNAVPNPAPNDLKVDPSGQYLYCVNNLDGSVSLFTIGGNGALSAVVATYSAGPDGTGAKPVALAVH